MAKFHKVSGTTHQPIPPADPGNPGDTRVRGATSPEPTFENASGGDYWVPWWGKREDDQRTNTAWAGDRVVAPTSVMDGGRAVRVENVTTITDKSPADRAASLGAAMGAELALDSNELIMATLGYLAGKSHAQMQSAAGAAITARNDLGPSATPEQRYDAMVAAITAALA